MAAKGSKHHNAILKEEDIPGIREDYRQGLGINALARKHGVAVSTIRRILQGATWRHIVDPNGPIVLRNSPGASNQQKLSLEKAKLIRYELESGTPAKVLAKRNKVCLDTIYRIKRYEIWRE
jgi:transposase